MSLGDIFDFELFNAKDMLGKVKKDPWRLLVGAGDPLSTKAWNKITGKNMEPLVDQMGGAYGGDWISAFGKGQDGGVYGRAKAAGIDTKAGGRAHDVAHVVSAIMAGNYGLGQMGGGAPSASAAPNSNLGIFSNGGKAGLDGLGGGNMGALARSGAVPGGAGMGSATPVTGMNWQDLVMKQGLGGMPGMNTGVPPQQPQPPQIQATDRLPGPTAQQIAGPTPPPMQQSLASRAMGGLGRARDALTPIDPRMAEGMDPEHIKQLRNQAMLRLGLGMMSNAHQGGRFGEAIAAGLGQAQGAFNKDIEGTYQRGVEAREEKRELDRQAMMDARYIDDRDYRRGRDAVSDERYDQERTDELNYRQRQLALSERQLDIAQQRADKTDRQTMKIADIDRMRNEHNRRVDKVRESRSFADQIMMLSANPNIAKDPSAQTAIVYAFGKMLDPESVVREAEYAIIERSRGLQEQLQAIVPRLSEGARLTPDQIKRMRDVAQQYITSNQDRMNAMSDYYGELATRRGVDPFEVTGKQWRSKEEKNTVDMSGLGGLGTSPPTGFSNSMTSPTGMRIVDVDF